MADLASLRKNIKDTFTFELKLEGASILNEDDTPMTITFNGPNTKAAQEVDFDMQDEAIQDWKDNSGEEPNINSRKMDEIKKKRLARQAHSWNITDGGIKPEFSTDAVLEFFNEFPVFFKQAEAEYEVESGFTLA